jgi:hybrid cluster-associated redox disulfide protein
MHKFASLTIEDIVSRFPATRQVFERHNTACVGCVMDTFCTLSDAARAYDIPLAQLVDEISDAALAVKDGD